MAYVEAFARMGPIFEAVGGASEADFFAEADGRVASLREGRSGDVSNEGLVFGMLFHEFAQDVGLDYVVRTYVNCAVLTLQDYGNCVRDTEGLSSNEFNALRHAAGVYGVQLAAAPSPGSWSFCGNGLVCGRGEGDCDNDGHCAGNLQCLEDIGNDHGFSAAVDVCDLPMGHWDRCTPDFPCAAGEGDCDTDADCVGNRICVDNVGASYGMASQVDVCQIPARRQ